MGMKISPHVLALWLRALRNGRYPQCKGSLRRPAGFCVLGLLCEVHRAEHGELYRWGRAEDAGGQCWHYQGERYHLPDCVAAWAGLESVSPALGEITGRDTVLLTAHNDIGKGVGFRELADMIEAAAGEGVAA